LFCQQVDGIIQEHRFDIDRGKALEVLVHFDQSVIDSANVAFCAYSKRDGFDERKRHFAYFMGLVKRKQKEVDQARRNAAAEILRTQRLLDENAAHERTLEEEQRQEELDLKTRPERVILKYADLLMRGRFRLMRNMCFGRIRQGLIALRRLGRTGTQIIALLAVKIRSLPEFAEDRKDRMVTLLSEEIAKLTGTSSRIS
jgi:hypothetical protein